MLGCTQSRVAAFVLSAVAVRAIDLDVSDSNSIIDSSKTIVQDILNIYNANSSGPEIPGIFPSTYYWWESGLAFDSLINYWWLTGDDSVVDTIQDALLFQRGPNDDYMPANQTKNEGNDDQSTWALAAMTAAERRFPSRAGYSAWYRLAQNVFDAQAARWDSETCNGGIRWQIFSFNNGYTYKNSLSNGNFMQLAARLYRFTGNETYNDWAQHIYDWSHTSGLVAAADSDDALYVYDGFETITNCSAVNHLQWTASAGTYLAAADFLENSNVNASANWTVVTEQFFTGSTLFLQNDSSILTEAACAPTQNCDTDQLAFKAILARAWGNLKLMNTTADVNTITSALQNSAKGAAAQCSGGSGGTTCGSDWSSSTWDGTQGLGQDLSALEIILANLPGKQLLTFSTYAVPYNGTATSTGGANGTNATTGNSSSGANASGTPSVTPANGAGRPGLSMALFAVVALSAFAYLL